VPFGSFRLCERPVDVFGRRSGRSQVPKAWVAMKKPTRARNTVKLKSTDNSNCLSFSIRKMNLRIYNIIIFFLASIKYI
jgi:hypothetical protein